MCITALLALAQAQAQTASSSFNIPAQSLSAALLAFSNQSGVSVALPHDLAAGLTSKPLVGTFSSAEALKKLLDGTDLRFEFIDATTVKIEEAEAGRRSEAPTRARKPASEAAQDPTSGTGVEEIIVTAEKREEKLQEVPVPVGVIQAQAITDNNEVLLRDYFTKIPSFTVQPTKFSQQSITIRGIDSGGGDPTVAVTLDGLPLTGATGPTLGAYIPDVDPGDLARIEVLRGPQGTLYGVDSMGGLVNFVTTDPSTHRFTGRIEAGISGVYNGAEPGFQVRASTNIPIDDNLAIRVSGYGRQDPGYIDNPVLGLNGVNEAHAAGARIAALWQPSPDLSLRLSAIYQHIKWDGYTDSIKDPSLTRLQQNYEPGTDGYQRSFQAYSAILKTNIGPIAVTSSTGYNVGFNKLVLDFSYGFGSKVKAAYGVTGSPYTSDDRVTKFDQELRASSSIGSHIDWLAGFFYTTEGDPHDVQTINAEDRVTGRLVDPNFYRYESHRTYDEYAGFANLTYRFDDAIDIQFGGRESHISTQYADRSSGTLFGANVVVNPSNPSTSDVFTYLVTPRYKISDDLMVYARFASGFRSGGPNVGVIPPGVARQFNPDETRNYELGAKGKLLDGRITFDASLYYIDWQNIQLNLVDPSSGFNYGANGGSAKSQGAEITVTVNPDSKTTLSGWIAYDDAELTSNFPRSSTVIGLSGDRLPTDPQWSAHLALDRDFDADDGLVLYTGGELSYVGDRLGTFTATGIRDNYPAYVRLDLRTGLILGPWKANLFLNNATDTRGIVGLGTTPNSIVYITPRTVGLNVIYQFE